MKPICTAERVRGWDEVLIQRLGIPGRQLMEIAGKAAADAVHQRWPTAAVAVLCGPGNNGGDGYVVARWLHLQGHRVQTWAWRSPGTPDTQANADLARRAGVPVAADRAQAIAQADLVVDALLGTGQSRPPSTALAAVLDACRDQTIVALDLPTGFCADTGQKLGASAIHAVLTLTIGAHKQGLFCEPARSAAGELSLLDIGMAMAAPHTAPADAWLMEAADIDGLHPAPLPSAAKWDRGHVGVIGGGGAAVLAAHGAFRGGAGLVTVFASERERPDLRGLWPEAIVAPVESLDPRRQDVLVLGPGLGMERGALVRELWTEFPRTMVVDADAISLLAPGLPPCAHPRILTPHSAEAGRLLGSSRQDVDADRFAAVRALAALGQPCLLKGPTTLIAAAQTVWANPTGHPNLATAGSGDVLAGLIAARVAGGAAPHQAMQSAVWDHGRAGARMPRLGTASDLVAALRGP